MNANDIVYALDFETCYSEEVSVSHMGVYNYVTHPFAEPFMVAIVGSDGFEYVGAPEDAPWQMLDGQTVVAHNAGFDAGVFEYRLKRPEKVLWEDSAALAAWLQAGRSLKNASFALLGKDVSKAVRDLFKGKSREDIEYKDLFGESLITQTRDYCLQDTRLCLELWLKYAHLWPEDERRMARLTWQWANRGIRVNQPLLQEGVERMESVKAEAVGAVPWSHAGVLNEKARNKHLCQLLQIEHSALPTSWGADDPGFLKFLERYSENREVSEVLTHLKRFHKANTTLRKLENIRGRTTPDGRMCYNMLYCGAPHTARWSGGRGDKGGEGGGLNVQNLTKNEFEGVNLRHIFVPRPGYKFVIADFSQIELVVLKWLVKDTNFLKMFAGGMDGYEAVAVERGEHDPELGALKDLNPDLRFALKVENLGAQYGMGAGKLGGMIGDPEKATEIINNFRAKNPGVTALWANLGNAMLEAAQRGETQWDMALPSGRSISYFNLHVKKGEYGLQCWANTAQDKHVKSWWGGSLTENACQGVARDALKEALLRLEDHSDDKGWYVNWHVHDEAILEVPEEKAETCANRISELMCVTPDWAEGLPLRVGYAVADHYLKD